MQCNTSTSVLENVVVDDTLKEVIKTWRRDHHIKLD